MSSMPARPEPTCSAVVPSPCGWNHSVQAFCRTVNCGFQVVPGAITFCGPPSIDGGTCSPCQCTVVLVPMVLVTSMRTRSPSSTLMTGPRYGPLKPAVLLVTPVRSVAVPVCMVRPNTFTPLSSVGDSKGGTGSVPVAGAAVCAAVPAAGPPAARDWADALKLRCTTPVPTTPATPNPPAVIRTPRRDTRRVDWLSESDARDSDVLLLGMVLLLLTIVDFAKGVPTGAGHSQQRHERRSPGRSTGRT